MNQAYGQAGLKPAFNPYKKKIILKEGTKKITRYYDDKEFGISNWKHTEMVSLEYGFKAAFLIEIDSGGFVGDEFRGNRAILKYSLKLIDPNQVTIGKLGNRNTLKLDFNDIQKDAITISPSYLFNPEENIFENKGQVTSIKLRCSSI
jgi:hypothetical protein